ncbi:hypothetical protein HPB47_007839 [Ixodes persulcatus]|uniref:Uncharacterized protein n=1 Tax=Ixodes persulcatus TaxID=34615 RepID=A0AC60P6Q9_IXOPE|nr:hypothetical protein HPB47_007839 [Ixodes persulcatus]
MTAKKGGLLEGEDEDKEQELALRYAIDRINNNNAILPSSRLHLLTKRLPAGDAFHAFKTGAAVAAPPDEDVASSWPPLFTVRDVEMLQDTFMECTAEVLILLAPSFCSKGEKFQTWLTSHRAVLWHTISLRQFLAAPRRRRSRLAVHAHPALHHLRFLLMLVLPTFLGDSRGIFEWALLRARLAVHLSSGVVSRARSRACLVVDWWCGRVGLNQLNYL